MNVRGVGLSQTDKTTRSIAHAVEVAPLDSHSGGLGRTATPYVFFPPSQTLPHYQKNNFYTYSENHGRGPGIFTTEREEAAFADTESGW